MLRGVTTTNIAIIIFQNKYLGHLFGLYGISFIVSCLLKDTAWRPAVRRVLAHGSPEKIVSMDFCCLGINQIRPSSSVNDWRGVF